MESTSDRERAIWFRHRWWWPTGVQPVTWQGWLVTLTSFVFLVGGAVVFGWLDLAGWTAVVVAWAIVIAPLAGFVQIAKRHTPSARWSWWRLKLVEDI